MSFQTLKQWLDWQQTLNPAEIDLGLDRIRRVMQQAALPDHFDCPLIIVAGTNGKGSVVATIEAIAVAAGLRVASYTSPHLLRYNERIRFDREIVSDEVLCAAFARIDQARGDIALTYFEFGTLAAIDLFHRDRPDLVVMEIGLGGRLDAVNVMQPDVSVITTIALDHTDWLGETREQIAVEKAGVMRRGKITVVGEHDPPLALLQQAEKTGACLWRIDHDFSVEHAAVQWRLWQADQTVLALPPPALVGAHQYDNTACAIMVLRGVQPALAISEDDIRRALPDIRLPGRLQLLQNRPQVVADVAHNAEAVAALVAQCHHQPVSGQTHLVLGMLADKPVADVARLLRPLAAHWHLADLHPLAPRGLSAEALAALLEPHCGGVKLHTHASVGAACDSALRAMTEQDRLLICGSFYTVAEAMPLFSASC